MGIEGIIRPPPEIRAVTHKTALFVSKNGRAFEARIFNSAKGKTPKFAFLHETSPFHQYYEERILFYQNGGTDADDAEVATATKEKEKEKETKTETETKVVEVDVEKGGDDDGDGKGKDGSNDVDKASSIGTDATKKEENEDVGIKSKVKKSSRKAKSIIDPVARALLTQRAIVLASNNNNSTSTNDTKATPDDTTATATTTTTTTTPSPNAKQKTPHPPTKLIYTTTLPPKSITPVQLEILKTTAQFVALDGKQGGTFLRDLTVREWNDPRTFGFLQPRHGDFAYFSSLVDLYRRLLAKCVYAKEVYGGGIGGGKGDVGLLTVMKMKAMVGLDTTTTANNTETTSNEAPSSNSTYHSQIAHEYSYLQSTANDVSSCLSAAAYTTEYHRARHEKKRAELQRAMEDGGGGGGTTSSWGGTSRIDWHDFVVVETIEFGVDEVVEMLPPPPPPLPKVVADVVPPPPPKEEEDGEDMEDSSDEEEDDADRETIDVVPNYTPKVVSSQSKFASTANTHVIDPITKKLIPIDDMTEHMRIQLLDPKWAAEKKRFMDKQKDSNLVEGEMIARNVGEFARARGGVLGEHLFGSSREELLGREEEGKRRLEEANRIIRDQQHAQAQMAMPRPMGGGGGGNHTTVMMGVPSQHHTQTMLNQQQTTVQTILTSPTTTTTADTTMIHHAKPDLSLPDAKKPRSMELLPTSGADDMIEGGVSHSTTAPATTTVSLLSMVPPTHTAMAPSGITPTLLTTPSAQPPPPNQNDPDTETITTTLSETDFAKSLPSPTVTLSIQVPPSNNSGWNFNGQIISVPVDVMTTIKAVKGQLTSELGGMPVNKMQLKSAAQGFLKDGATLAFLNIGGGTGALLELLPKVRGRRK